MSHRQKKEKVRESAGESEEKTGEKYDELRGVRRGETCATRKLKSLFLFLQYNHKWFIILKFI